MQRTTTCSMYMKLTQIIFLIFASLALSGCGEEMSPLVAGTINYRLQGGAWIERPISQLQLQSLEKWLKPSLPHWQRCLITPPGVSLSIALKHENGDSSSLRQLHFSNSDATFMASYLSGSNFSDQPCALQSFSKEDIRALYSLLEVPL